MSVIILSISDLIGMSLHIPIRFASTISDTRLRWIQREEWYPKRFQGWLGVIFPQGFTAVYLLLQQFPWSIGVGMYAATQDDIQWFWNVREQRRARKILVRKMKNDPAFAPRHVQKWERIWRKFDRIARRALHSDFHHQSLRMIGQLYERCVDLAMQQAALGYLSESLLTAGEDDWLVVELRKAFRGRVPKDDEERCIATLTAPTIPTFTQQEEYSRAQLASLWQRGQRGRSFERARVKHIAHFATIRGNYFSVPALTIQEVQRSLSSVDVQRVRAQWRTFTKNVRAKEQLIRRYHLTSLRPLLRAATLFTHMQDYRKWAVTKVNAVIFRVVDELARRLRVSRETLLYATPNDIIAACEGKKVDWKRIASWRKGCLFWYTKGGVTVYSGDAFRRINLAWFYGVKEGMNELKGTTAMQGRAQGRVRLVRGTVDIRAFKQGEILVANNTTPEYLPAMKKAAAIVTEQGGITTHAAIISRELKIPCVIGTKIATKVLKDGDRVEVDAMKGIVRKL